MCVCVYKQHVFFHTSLDVSVAIHIFVGLTKIHVYVARCSHSRSH